MDPDEQEKKTVNDDDDDAWWRLPAKFPFEEEPAADLQQFLLPVAEEEEEEEEQQHNSKFGDLARKVSDEEQQEEEEGGQLIMLSDIQDQLLELRDALTQRENEVRNLRMQLSAQAQMLDFMQADLLMSAESSQRIGVVGRGSSKVGYPDTPLLAAVTRGDAETVRLLITERKADVHEHSGAPLLLACQEGQYEVVAALLELGADVHQDHDSALIWAARQGDARLAALLRHHGADTTALHSCALRIAIANGRRDVVRALVAPNTNAPPDAPDAPQSQSPHADLVHLYGGEQ